MNLKWGVLLLITGLTLTGCSSSNNENNEPEQQGTSAKVTAQMPATESSACTRVGGKMAISHQLDGSSINLCQLSDGRRCNAYALSTGNCQSRF